MTPHLSFALAGALLVSAACSRPAEPPPAAKKPTRRELAAAQRAATATAPPAKPEQPKCSGKPNFLVVVLDTLRYDASQIDPNSRNETPFLASLRQRGLNFTSAYSTSDSTPISHFSILSGYVIGWQGPIDVPEASVPHQLRRAGYRSFGVSANGNLSQASYRLAQGFDRYVCLQDVYEKMSPEQKASALVNVDERIKAYGGELNDWTRLFVWSSASQVLPRVRTMLDRTRKPFFGFINFIDMHDPYMPDPRHYSKTGEKAAVGELRFRPLPREVTDPESVADEKRRELVKTKIVQAGGRAWSTAFDLTPAEIAVYKRRYLAEVRDVDRDVKALFAMLEERKLLDNTVVILTSDHGEAFGEDQLMTHSFNTLGVRESTNHVPLLVLFPPCYRIKPRAVDDLTGIADIAPTIYDLAGVDWKSIARRGQPGFFGRSLLPYIQADQQRANATVAGESNWKAPAAGTKKKQDEEAERRLRSLGYLR